MLCSIHYYLINWWMTKSFRFFFFFLVLQDSVCRKSRFLSHIPKFYQVRDWSVSDPPRQQNRWVSLKSVNTIFIISKNPSSSSKPAVGNTSCCCVKLWLHVSVIIAGTRRYRNSSCPTVRRQIRTQSAVGGRLHKTEPELFRNTKVDELGMRLKNQLFLQNSLIFFGQR